jgi:metal-sulfur cluster biosynthetic enzyme
VDGPELGKSLVELDIVHDVAVEDGRARLALALTTLACPLTEPIVDDVQQAVLALDGVQEVQVNLREMTPREKERIWPKQQQRRLGMGPMTGRGAGYCGDYGMPGYASPMPGRGGTLREEAGMLQQRLDEAMNRLDSLTA